MLHDELILLLLGGGKKEDISLHAMDEQPRNDLDIWICLLHPLQVLLTVVFACIQNHSLRFVSPLLPEVVIAWHEVIKLLHVLQRQLDSLLPPI